MKLVKSLLLGSAAGLAAVAGAQAADLPVRKAAPVEYVRVCTAFGAGYFFIPGTDTCIRVGGRARLDYIYSETLSRGAGNGSVSGTRVTGRLNLDARTQTAYGTLRTFVRFDISARSGVGNSGTAQRYANAYPALGADTFGQLQQYVTLDKGFIQFAGLTAGRVQSFFDFYAHDLEFNGSSSGSDTTTNALAYTATFGNGFSATLSMEDATYRRTPIFGVGGAFNAQTGYNVFTGAAQFAVVQDPALGGTLTSVDVLQKDRLPDFVGQLRYDAAWGSAQLSAAVHEINVGQSSGLINPVTGAAITGNFPSGGRVASEYGWAVQGGLKINTPFIAPGDLLWLQGAYSEGAMTYGGNTISLGSENASAAVTNGGFVVNLNDAVINPVTRKLNLTESWSIVASYLHYWTPEWRSAVFASYGETYFNKGTRLAEANTGFGFGGINLTTGGAAAANAFNFSSTLRDWSILYVGATLIWSPVRDLDIGVEGIYQRTALLNGRTGDTNRLPGVNNSVGGLTANGVPLATVSSFDNYQVRFRVQRDF